jgi:signal peptidase II
MRRRMIVARQARVAGMALILIAWLIDRTSKAWVFNHFASSDSTPIRLGPVLNIVFGWNQGISFGLFDNRSELGRWFLIWVTAAVAIVLGAWMWRSSSRIRGAALGLVIGGALGNIYDRVRFGAVADFIDVHVGNIHFWTFNGADSAITLGVLLLIWDSLAGQRGLGSR